MKIFLAVLMSLNFVMACDLKNFISELKSNNKNYIIHKENRTGIEDLKVRQQRVESKYREAYKELDNTERYLNINRREKGN